MGTETPLYRGFRYPVEIISHGVWLYHRFPLSFREVQEMMLQRGIVVSHETIRQWCVKFGQTYANGAASPPAPPRRYVAPRRGIPHDERSAAVSVARAVDQDGNVLDILVTSRRDTKAATRFFRKLLKGLEYVPRVVVTDKLGSYPAARRRVARSVEHRRSKYLNNRAENSRQPTRQRERAMNGSPHPGTRNDFCPPSAGYHRTSGPVVTCSTARNTAARWPTASVPGMKSPG